MGRPDARWDGIQGQAKQPNIGDAMLAIEHDNGCRKRVLPVGCANPTLDKPRVTVKTLRPQRGDPPDYSDETTDMIQEQTEGLHGEVGGRPGRVAG